MQQERTARKREQPYPLEPNTQSAFDSLSIERQEEVESRARQQLRQETKENNAAMCDQMKEVTSDDFMSRRGMLQAAMYSGIGYFASSHVWKKMFDDNAMHRHVEEKISEANPITSETEPNTKTSFHDRSLLRAAGQIGWDAFLLKIGQISAVLACHELGIRVGNANFSTINELQNYEIERLITEIDKRGSEFAKALFTKVCISGPIKEEMLFRIIPSILINSEERRWDIGIPSAILFAMVHNIVEPSRAKDAIALTDNKVFSLEWIPLPQFMGGVFYWYLAREYGPVAPVVMHMLNNFPAALLLSNGTYAMHQRLESLKEEFANDVLKSNVTVS